MNKKVKRIARVVVLILMSPLILMYFIAILLGFSAVLLVDVGRWAWTNEWNPISFDLLKD